MKKAIILFTVILLLCFVLIAEEGMYPISEIHKLESKLIKKGLKISTDKIYNPNKVSLIDAICIVGGGCTGSFISSDGLILTNHHCAYRAIQSASSEENDYIKNGFIAETRQDEIKAKGYTIRITESYKDVSKKVLSVVKEGMDYKERTKAIEKKIKEIVKKTEEENPGKRAEVSEMFQGKTYVLFIYTYLKDVRLVYAPPRSIGNFGGDIDNWEWPRHTGDFSLLRAYVGPDKSSAEYSKDNIPYTPRNYLKIAPEGVKENDFAFILGYPGRTYTHRTSYFLEYQQKVYMPYIIQFYDWMINVMESVSNISRSVAIKHLSLMRGLANVSKKYKGRMKGMKRLDMIKNRRQSEKKLQQFINSEKNLSKEYGDILNNIKEIYETRKNIAKRNFILDHLRRFVKLFGYGFTAYEASIERKKPDIEREDEYMDRNYKRTKERLLRSFRDYYTPTDRLILKELMLRALELKTENKITYIEKIVKDKQDKEGAIIEFINKLYKSTMLNNKQFVKKLLENPDNIKECSDPYIEFIRSMYLYYKQKKEEEKELKGRMDKLSAKLIEVKKKFLGKDFVPDANGTLRLTYGNIIGYSPRDAVYYKPFTTLKGVVQKQTGKTPFDAPQKLLNIINKVTAANAGSFYYHEYKSVPVCMLYDTHTTGGNSGSPVLNSKGQLIGLNFDRAFEATINDYEWNKKFSRSIGVDIRYILWIIKNYAGLDYLLEEMDVNN